MIQLRLERLLLLPVLISRGQRKMLGIPLIHFQISLKLREAFLLPLDLDQVKLKPQQLDGQRFDFFCVLNMVDMYDCCCITIEKYTRTQKMEEIFHGSFFPRVLEYNCNGIC